MANRENAWRLMVREMEKIPSDARPRLLLHVCCAPCSTAVLELLCPVFYITVYYDNPNIDTLEEYEKRALEVRRFTLDSGLDAETVVAPYEPEVYDAAVAGYEDSREGGPRCERCFRLRLFRSAAYAAQNRHDWFTTTLTISPMKTPRCSTPSARKRQRNTALNSSRRTSKARGYQRSVALSEVWLVPPELLRCVHSRRSRVVGHNQITICWTLFLQSPSGC